MIILIILSILSSCTNKNITLEQLLLPKAGEEIVQMQTSYGSIKIRLFPDIAPMAVENFKTLVEQGYFNNKTFHKIRQDDFIMAVDSEVEDDYLESIWGESFEDEFSSKYCHFRGALSMANRGANTNGSSFFIVSRDDIDDSMIDIMKELGEDEGFSKEVINAYESIGGIPELDFAHTVFGQVFEGLDVIDKISNVEVDYSLKPFDPVIIEKAEIIVY